LISGPPGDRLTRHRGELLLSFIETVRRARELLREEGRVTLRGLKREFDLDDEALEELA
jgi:hypothetical protein